MIQVDGSRYSGSGTIVRQAVAFAALTGQDVHIVNARVKRPKPGLRLQHLRVVEAIRELVGGTSDGVSVGSQEIVFRPAYRTGRPGTASTDSRYTWDIGSAGSTAMLALALLPVLAFRAASVEVELIGGLFQDYAPSFYHLQQVMLPLLERLGIDAEMQMARPGYVPRGGGVLRLSVCPLERSLRPLVMEHPGEVQRLWGIALASRLEERRVSHRMAEAAQKALDEGGYRAEFEICYDTGALQPGAALAAFADLSEGARLGADRAGAPRRTAESIGRYVAHQLLEDLGAGATLDRYAADQIIPFAALARGESRFQVTGVTDHMQTGAWLASEFLGAEVRFQDHLMVIRGADFRPGLR